MKIPNPELIDQENPEWTEEDFAKAVPFSGLTAELQKLLSQTKQEREETASRSARQPAA
ncbi:MAG: hypothetical protein ABR906_02845 [Terracidiphilus sp.]|jgi:hypothetical protein